MTETPLRVLIVDDEPLARLRLARYLARHHPDWTVAEAHDGVEALAAIAAAPPDLMLLDVEMPELSGFDVLLELGEARRFPVIFQTAFDQFAVKAFDANACDYLLKPFTDERLAQALAKAVKTGAAPLADLEAGLREGGRFMDKLVINAGPRQRIVAIDEVLYFTSEEHVTQVVLASGPSFAYSHSLSYLEERLDPARFLRLHRNALVRLDAIVTVERGANAKVTLKNGAVLAVSRERRKALTKIFGEG